jgi:hypothetical protein
MTDSTESVVAELNVALGTDYRLVRQLTGGFQSGAFELTVGTTAAGSLYQLEEFVSGTPVRDYSVVDESLARELIAVCELQRDLVPEPGISCSSRRRCGPAGGRRSRCAPRRRT